MWKEFRNARGAGGSLRERGLGHSTSHHILVPARFRRRPACGSLFETSEHAGRGNALFG